ncbi:MAG: carbamoyltransferase HypF [Prochlorothrix sp.]|nr:carbamoyltransferase HypF [Prochlorothrix sp.]
MNLSRSRYHIQGLVQGVGFRPFVYGLARELGLTGWVCNSSEGVTIEVQGEPEPLQQFQDRLDREKPPHSQLHQVVITALDLCPAEADFTIHPSQGHSPPTAFVLPDLATCSACLGDLWNPDNRRHRYPFTNCTHCGPRYSIIHRLPYDRPHTTLAQFPLCPACAAEYADPGDRRFHAQPNACSVCGPCLSWWPRLDANQPNFAPEPVLTGEQALQAAIQALRAGKILAIKGLGGFHLMVNAQDEAAVQQLRQRKQRPQKPLAVMFADFATVSAYCQVSAPERDLLQSPEAPIVLLARRDRPSPIGPDAPPGTPLDSPLLPLAPSLAPGNPNLGVMLPYTPLHSLLLRECGFPVVATSGNGSGDPLCWQTGDALERLGSIADGILSHDRPIARPVDDSMVRWVADRPLILRRARGYAPLPLFLGENPTQQTILALGSHLKNTIALYHQGQVILSPHIGDLETLRSRDRLQETLATLCRLYELRPTLITCDAHPDYGSSQLAQILSQSLATDPQQPLPILPVQHHYAHIRAVMAEQQLQGPVLGIAWDGLGLGLEGTLWGGEFLRVEPSREQPGFRRVAHWRQFPLPGGDRAAREPRRSALGLLHAIGDGQLLPVLEPYFRASDWRILNQALDRGLNCPLTSSMGRLFDGIAALLGLETQCSFEGQGAMAVEFAAQRGLKGGMQGAIEAVRAESLAQGLGLIRPAVAPPGEADRPWVLDWEPIVGWILQHRQRGTAPEALALGFHDVLVDSIVAVAQRVGLETVVLGGGCFQNQLLLTRSVAALRSAGFDPHWPQHFPPNDGGLALGQIAAVLTGLAADPD